MRHRVRRVGLWLWIALAMACGAAGERVATTGTIDTFDVHVAVRADGGLDVRETLRVTPDAGTIDVRRAIASRTADAVEFGAASIDGEALAPGIAGLTVDGGATPLVVSWQRDGVQAPATLELTYAVTSAVGVRRPRGELAWPVLDGRLGVGVGAVTVALDVPDGSPIYEGTGMAEAGWTVEVAGAQVIARRDHVAAGESATLLAVFDVDRTVVRRGEWEWNLDRQEQYALALVSGGIFILIIGVGILALLRLQYPPVPASADAEVRASARATRRMVSRGLVVSGVVTLVFAGAFAMVASVWLTGLGPALQAIPASSGVVALMFLAAGWWYGRER